MSERQAANGTRPEWFDEIVEAARQIQGEDISQFLPPADGSARESAVLMLFGEGPSGPDLLLTERSHTMRSHPGQVSFPGGRLDPGETAEEAALREAWEETGLEVEFGPRGTELVHVDVHGGPRGHTHLDLRYLLVAGDIDPNPPEGESQDVRWFGWEDAISVADDGLRGVLVALRPTLTEIDR